MLQICSMDIFAQGYNHTWPLGYWPYNYDKGRMTFDSNSYNYNLETRKMMFNGTEATICDSQGNFLMSSNGVWIANANNDTMLNGTGLNPGSNVNSWPNGLLNEYANIFLTYPNDSNKFILFHHTDSFDGFSYSAYDLYYTIIDKTLDSGRGAVISKNNIAFSDTLNWGIAACRHANGRDWWIVMSKHNTSVYYIVLCGPNGITSINTQTLNWPYAWYNSSQLCFNQLGNKFMNCTYDSTSHKSFMLLADFNRCTGQFSNEHTVQLTKSNYVFGISFSPSGKFAYGCSSQNIFQVNATTLQVDTVATYDGFSYPLPGAATTFWNMYLAANGKIYITSGNGVQHLHEMNYPDSAGLGCDVQQHSIFLNIWNFRALPNHPNYYLGCDTSLGCPCYAYSSINENGHHDFRFRVYPNPIKNNFVNIGYILPQNKNGILKLYDINGKQLYSQGLPPWSNEQGIKLPLLCNGMYNLVIQSDNFIASKKIIIAHDK